MYISIHYFSLEQLDTYCYGSCELCNRKTKPFINMSSNASNSSRPGKRKKKGSSQQDKSSETLPSPAKSVSPPPSGRSSPDPVCSICLGRHESKCFTNNCLHEFCFKCLLEWSKVFPFLSHSIFFAFLKINFYLFIYLTDQS